MTSSRACLHERARHARAAREGAVMSVTTLPKLVTEAEAYLRFADVLEAKELRRARAEGLIGFYRRKKKIILP